MHQNQCKIKFINRRENAKENLWLQEENTMITENAQHRGTYSVTLSKGISMLKLTDEESKCVILRKQARSEREEG